MSGYGSDADATERAVRIVAGAESAQQAERPDWFVIAVIAVILVTVALVAFGSLWWATPPAGAPDCAQISAKTQTRTTVTQTEIAELCR